jgi:outer membrane receptor protein involved in Fe transport
MNHRNMRIIGMLVLSVLMVTGLFAQSSTTGSIEGTVKDKTGAVPGVTVELRSPQLIGVKSDTTDAAGHFRFLALPPGTYTLTAALAGFNTTKQEGLQVNLGRTVTLDVMMSQAASEQITVTAAAPVVDVTSNTTGANVSSETFQTLPVARNFYAVAQVAPGTAKDATGTTVYGSTGAENQYIIDGLNTTGVDTGLEGKTLNFDFIQEVEVKTGGLPAEYGRITGGIINAITKSGGNEFHGDVFGFDQGRNAGLTSKDATQSHRRQTVTGITNVQSQADFGFDAGGYLLKDKVWFFGADNIVKQTNEQTIFRPAGYVNPATGIFSPAPGAPGVGAKLKTSIDRNLYAGKITYNATQNQNLYVSAFGDPSTNEGPQFAVAGPATTYQGKNTTGGTDIIGHYSGIFATTFLVNASIGQHKEKSILTGAGTSIAFHQDISGAKPYPTSGGFGFWSDQTFKRKVYKLDMDKYFASHDIKFGGDMEDIDAVNANHNGGAGQRIYHMPLSSRADRGGGMAYFRHRYYVDTHAPGFNQSNSATFVPLNALVSKPVTKNTSAYLQDSWKVLPNFTINAGLRWEQQKATGAAVGAGLKLDNNLAPRLGLIWDVQNNGRSKVYANYGRFYESIPMDINIRSFGEELSCFCYNRSDDPAVFKQDNTVRPASILGGPTDVDPSLKGQYIDEFLVGYDMEVAPNFAVGVKGTYRNLGRVIEDMLSNGTGAYSITNPGSGLGSLVTFYSDGTTAPAPAAKRKFTGVELHAHKAFSNNYQFYASYLWSRLEGNYDGTFQASTGQLDPNINSAYDYADFSVNNNGLLSNDRTHQLKFDGSYTFRGGFKEGLNVGFSTHYLSGAPLTAYGYSGAYQNWEYYLTPRGSLGRGPADYEADLHVGYPWSAGSVKLNFLVDVFNLLNRQAATSVDQRWNNQDESCGVSRGTFVAQAVCTPDGGIANVTGTLNPVGKLDLSKSSNSDFLKAGVTFTQPRSIRLGIRASF